MDIQMQNKIDEEFQGVHTLIVFSSLLSKRAERARRSRSLSSHSGSRSAAACFLNPVRTDASCARNFKSCSLGNSRAKQLYTISFMVDGLISERIFGVF